MTSPRTVAWKTRGDHYTSGGSWSITHLAPAMTDVNVGSFPTYCGVWVPDAWDAEIATTSPRRGAGTCRRCRAAVERERAARVTATTSTGEAR